MTWNFSGRTTNPITDAVLVDTGALAEGYTTFMVVAASTVAAVFEVQYRNAANNATLKSQIIAVPANGMAVIPDTSMNFPIAANERIRVIQVVGVTGQVSVSLFMS